MSEHRKIDTSSAQELVAEFLKSHNFEPQFVEKLLETFISVCRTLNVSDPADPQSSAIARTLILMAAEGERDPEQLYKRTLSQVSSNR